MKIIYAGKDSKKLDHLGDVVGGWRIIKIHWTVWKLLKIRQKKPHHEITMQPSKGTSGLCSQRNKGLHSHKNLFTNFYVLFLIAPKQKLTRNSLMGKGLSVVLHPYNMTHQ